MVSFVWPSFKSCDLMPLDIVAEYIEGLYIKYVPEVIKSMAEFQRTHDKICLFNALFTFQQQRGWGVAEMFLELAKHFEEGAEKYGEHNWEKGIPIDSFIDSAVRHYLKYLRGDKDEPHDRAFVWNLMCCAWTVSQ